MLSRLFGKKFHTISRAVVMFGLFFLIVCSLSACGVVSFEEGKADREKVVDLILDGSMNIAENGVITLPTEMKALSDTGECQIVEFNGRSAIYFFEACGILGESSGYVYVTDRIFWKDYVNEDVYTGTLYWYDVEQIESNWYSVKTE